MSELKKSYTVQCSSSFREDVNNLARKRKVNAADLARSVMILLPFEIIENFPDPGEPKSDDREEVILRSGSEKGRLLRRKPRLQLRLPEGLRAAFIRQTLALSLSLDQGRIHLGVGRKTQEAELMQVQEENERLRAIVSALSFNPLDSGIKNYQEALHVLGFSPHARPDMKNIRARFKVLAMIYHPDSLCGDHHRMTQLNAALSILAGGHGLDA